MKQLHLTWLELCLIRQLLKLCQSTRTSTRITKVKAISTTIRNQFQCCVFLADGVWVWAGWTTCSTTCGTGTRTRSATSCHGPFYAGMNCSGSGTETEACQSMLVQSMSFKGDYSSFSFQLKELGQLGVRGAHAQRHVILALELEQEAIPVVSHVLAVHLIPEIVTVSWSKIWIWWVYTKCRKI